VREEPDAEPRCFPPSDGRDPERSLAAVRAHREIEKSLHRVLDVTVNDEHPRNRIGRRPENPSALRKVALDPVPVTPGRQDEIPARHAETDRTARCLAVSSTPDSCGRGLQKRWPCPGSHEDRARVQIVPRPMMPRAIFLRVRLTHLGWSDSRMTNCCGAP